MTPRELALDSYRSWSLCIACMREIAIRRGCVKPAADRPEEQAWAKEGPVPNNALASLSRPDKFAEVA